MDDDVFKTNDQWLAATAVASGAQLLRVEAGEVWCAYVFAADDGRLARLKSLWYTRQPIYATTRAISQCYRYVRQLQRHPEWVDRAPTYYDHDTAAANGLDSEGTIQHGREAA